MFMSTSVEFELLIIRNKTSHIMCTVLSALQTHCQISTFRNEFNFRNFNGIMNTSGVLQSN